VFENKTVNNVQADLLATISDVYEKKAGYLIYELTRSFAIAESDIYLVLEKLFNKLDVNNLTGDELTKYVLQRKGIVRKSATYAKAILTVTGIGFINTGDLFATSAGIQFKSLENKTINGADTILAQAVLAGVTGNVPAGAITQMPITLAGISGVTNNEKGYDGYDSESDDSLRTRYYDALRKPVTGSNKNSYIAWAKSRPGVGNAICYPLWNGDNTVKVIIVDSNNQPASEDIVQDVQEYIDPKGTYDSNTGVWSTWGIGTGEAQIGVYCTVESAVAKTIDMKVKVIKTSSNYTDEEIIESIKEGLCTYFSSVALNTDNNYISFAREGNILLQTPGISDYESNTLEVNNGQENIILNLTALLTEVPVVGTVTLL